MQDYDKLLRHIPGRCRWRWLLQQPIADLRHPWHFRNRQCLVCLTAILNFDDMRCCQFLRRCTQLLALRLTLADCIRAHPLRNLNFGILVQRWLQIENSLLPLLETQIVVPKTGQSFQLQSNDHCRCCRPIYEYLEVIVVHMANQQRQQLELHEQFVK